MRSSLPLIAVLSLLAGVSAPAHESDQATGQPGQVATPPQPGPQQRTPARAGAAGEEMPTGNSVIRGYVVGMETGAPIRRAFVRAFASELKGQRSAITDADGRYEFRDLPAGRYTVSASKAGYVSLQYGQRRPLQPGTPIELQDKQVLEKVVIGLPRGSVLAGRITDEFGEPVANANVSALQWRRIGGTGRWTGTSQPARTDDLGHYRVFGLAPGEYTISATVQGEGFFDRSEPSGDMTGFAPTYFPGVPSMGDAGRITLGVGEENTNASFALIAARLVSVEGTVTSAKGTPVTQGTVFLRPGEPGSGNMFMGPGNMGRIDQQGRFRINSVAPGRYIAQANVGRGGPDDSGEIGRLPITVAGEKIENAAIVMTPGGRITGRVITETGAPLPSMRSTSQFDEGGLRVMASVVNPGEGGFMGTPPARVDANGTFELKGLVDARRITVTAPSDWMVKSVMVSGREYVDTPIEVQPGQTLTGMEVLLTNRISTVSGLVTDSRGLPVLDASILVFVDDREFWQLGSRYIRTARPDQQGRYRIERLPPHGAYLAVAVQMIEEGQAMNPDYLATMQQSATRFSLREGEGTTVDLKLKQ